MPAHTKAQDLRFISCKNNDVDIAQSMPLVSSITDPTIDYRIGGVLPIDPRVESIIGPPVGSALGTQLGIAVQKF